MVRNDKEHSAKQPCIVIIEDGPCLQALPSASPKLQMATIDHAMWFHRDFRMDDWLLYAIDSPSASNARGLVRGQVFNRDGQLVASTIQEGLIRQRG